MTSDDVRIGEIMQNQLQGDVVLLGFPHDEGVRRNGGRVGAAGAPAVVRKHLRRIAAVNNLEYNIDLRSLTISDAGDIDPELPLEEAHEQLQAKVNEIVRSGGIPFVIGGGNDESFPNAMGLFKEVGSALAAINIDAHFDVRPLKEGKVHSGSPFRLLLETEGFDGRNFTEFAAQGAQCSAEHCEYLASKGSRVMWLSHIKEKGVMNAFNELLTELSDAEKAVFVSFDLDAVDSAHAPGVSCPAVVGLTAQEALQICFESGKNPNVKLFDLSEFNPMIEDYRTGRLVAMMFAYFAMGVAVRKRQTQAQ